MNNTYKVATLQLELVLNKNLYADGIISEKQFNEVNKIIYQKIDKYRKQIKNVS